jgi:hypothetical protein
MRTWVSLIALLSLFASAAAARDPLRTVLHPKADLPAFRVVLPEDWTDTIDATGNLLLASRDRAVNFSLSLTPSTSPRDALDSLARAVLNGRSGTPWDSREPAEISGHRGYRYTARIRHTNGVEVRVELVLVAVGDRHIASCALLLGERAGRNDETLARLVLAAIRLVPTIGPGWEH